MEVITQAPSLPETVRLVMSSCLVASFQDDAPQGVPAALGLPVPLTGRGAEGLGRGGSFQALEEAVD